MFTFQTSELTIMSHFLLLLGLNFTLHLGVVVESETWGGMSTGQVAGGAVGLIMTETLGPRASETYSPKVCMKR